MAIRIALCLLILLTCGRSEGAVFLPDAASRTGYGPTLEAWSVFWTGACAERIGFELGYTGHSEIQNMLPRVTSYARGAVPHVLKACPKADVIHVNVPGRKDGRPVVYQFEMHRSADWAVQDARWYKERINDTIAGGYLPADAGYHKALVRFQDGRFEAIYGKRMESHLEGANVKRHMQEGASPQRVSHHTIAGYWYELGSEQPNGRCPVSRDGYALWGSFTMLINRGSSDVRMLRTFCAEAGEKGHSDQLYLSTPRPSGFERDWGIEWVKFTDPLHEQLAAMDLNPADDAQTFARTRKPLFESDKLTLYPGNETWCSNRRIDAYYTVASEDRNQAFGGNYATAIAERARQVVNEYCGDAITASVSSYREGDDTPWDSMSFQFRPIQASAFGNDDGYLELLGQNLSERAKAHLAYLNANHLGPACTDAPFCELPGGRYLNAIYQGRGDLVREMDQLVRAEINAMLKGQMAQLNMTENPITQMFSGMIEQDDGFIVGAANKYMYSYAAWGTQCFKSGAKTRTFVHTTPPTETINFDGSTDYEPGQTFEADYTVNPEFFTLLERIGSHYGAPDSDSPLLNKAQRLVLQGLVRMKDDYGCSSPEVARFERNLIALAGDDLAGRALSVLSAPPSSASKPAELSEPQQQPKPSTPAAAQPAPVQTTQPSPAPAQPTPARPAPARPTQAQPMEPTPTQQPASAKPALSTAERYALMNAEVKALSEAFVAEINEANTAFQAQMQGASTDAERLEMLRTFNTEMAEMRTEVEQKTQAIRDKYKD
ncbi:MAG: hypothetical protein NXH85_15385 [Pseudomonadaceae bacterium]|nr:hypothetical protein [Pseudomonadaceae bacterium]